MNEKIRTWLIRLGWWIVLILLLWWALHSAPLADIWALLRQLQLWQLAVLMVFNIVIFVLITMRWWIIVRAQNAKVPFYPLVGFRLAAYGLSYFTVGPQVGGEPLQIIYLQRHYGLTYARATAAVIMDKLLELLTNFILIAAGVYAIFRVGILSGNNVQTTLGLIPLTAVLLWPLVHIILFFKGKHPLSALLRLAPARFTELKLVRLMIVSEYMAGSFTRRHPKALLASWAVSLLSWVLMLVEYGLMLTFLDVHMDIWQTLAALTAMLVSFLMPLPAGLGALEASQVFVMNALGYPSAVGISLCLLIRARDILLGGFGLLLAGGVYNR
jgi:glycosyltransferase 2 family protein